MTKQRDHFKKSKLGQLRVLASPSPIRWLFCSKRRDNNMCIARKTKEFFMEMPLYYDNGEMDDIPMPDTSFVHEITPIDMLLASIEGRYDGRQYSLF
jgi:hypothetical protein